MYLSGCDPALTLAGSFDAETLNGSRYRCSLFSPDTGQYILHAVWAPYLKRTPLQLFLRLAGGRTSSVHCFVLAQKVQMRENIYNVRVLCSIDTHRRPGQRYGELHYGEYRLLGAHSTSTFRCNATFSTDFRVFIIFLSILSVLLIYFRLFFVLYISVWFVLHLMECFFFRCCASFFFSFSTSTRHTVQTSTQKVIILQNWYYRITPKRWGTKMGSLKLLGRFFRRIQKKLKTCCNRFAIVFVRFGRTWVLFLSL